MKDELSFEKKKWREMQISGRISRERALERKSPTERHFVTNMI